MLEAKINVVTVEPMGKDRLPSVVDLLYRNGLPSDGLSECTATTLVAQQDGQVIGSVALELFGQDALLRSVAVDEEVRNEGVGRQLVCSALDLAEGHNVRRVFLLTETAECYFGRLGFRPIERGQIDSPVQLSVEFASACPQSAQAMVLELAERRI
jgi:amino-acid N-acetyltransferase